MSKVLYIIGIVLSVTFLFVCGYYITEVEAARSMAFSNYLSGYSTSTVGMFDHLAGSLTLEAGLISLVLFLFFIFADVTGIVKVKTKTMKVLGIIGLCLSGIYLIWDVLMIASPSHLTFDEVGGGFAFYALVFLAFSVVGLVQSIRYEKIKRMPVQAVGNSTHDLLDS